MAPRPAMTSPSVRAGRAARRSRAASRRRARLRRSRPIPRRDGCARRGTARRPSPSARRAQPRHVVAGAARHVAAWRNAERPRRPRFRRAEPGSRRRRRIVGDEVAQRRARRGEPYFPASSFEPGAGSAPSSPRRSARASITSRARAGTTLAALGAISMIRRPSPRNSRAPSAAQRLALVARVDEPRRGEQRVGAQRHRRRAGVIGASLDHRFDAQDADDRAYDAEVDALGFQHPALLDVEFEESARRRRAAPRRCRRDRRPPRAIASRRVSPPGSP